MPFPQSNFRLGPDSLADLDAIASALNERTGNPHIPSVFRRFFCASQRRAPTGEDGGRRETVVRTAPPDTVTVIPTPAEYIRAGERLMKKKWDEQNGHG